MSTEKLCNTIERMTATIRELEGKLACAVECGEKMMLQSLIVTLEYGHKQGKDLDCEDILGMMYEIMERYEKEKLH